jgi:hypothetical protein
MDSLMEAERRFEFVLVLYRYLWLPDRIVDR